jgi:hypothetical protein
MSTSVIFDHVLFFGRKYDEVLSVFRLSESDLAGRMVLDCNSGPDAFVAEATRRGFAVTGCDPVYAKSVEEIRAQGQADIAHSLARSTGRPESTGALDVAEFNRLKSEALEMFLRDFEEGKRAGRYVAGALPELPFADRAFDLVLSAHFLFIASPPRVGGMIDTEQFDLEFHRRAVRELIRVCRGQVRIFPFTKISEPDAIHPWAAQILGELAADGFRLAIVENDYDQGRYTGHHVLVIEPEPA